MGQGMRRYKSSKSRSPHTTKKFMGLCAAEADWLQEHGSEIASRYAGRWIAVLGSAVVAEGPSLETVLQSGRAGGHGDPLVMFIPSEPVASVHLCQPTITSH